MTQFLPPNLLALFAPRDPIPFLPPTQKLPFEKKTRGYAGVGQYLNLFEVTNQLDFIVLLLIVFIFVRIQKTHHHLLKLKLVKRDMKGRNVKKQSKQLTSLNKELHCVCCCLI